ncbi:MAG: M23 family metallopeptidase [Acidobacteria bacterium]|nr:M23 family metallopeptidase [Acidobacteriota bacterium]
MARVRAIAPTYAPGLLTALLLAGCVAGCRDAPPPPSGASLRDIVLTPDTMVLRGEVPRNTTLEVLLRTQGIAQAAAGDVISAARTVFDPRRLRAAQPYSLERTLDGALRAFEYEIDAESFLRVTATGISRALHAELVPIPRTLERVVAVGTIDEATPSLFQAMEATGEGAELTIALAGIFAGEIDFNSEVQPGDRFTVAFDKYTRPDRPATYGHITAAEFQNEGRVIKAIRFTSADGRSGYYDEQGRSLKRFFLRSPLKFEPRVTSRFSTRRMHPVLHTARAHRGVDYGAPHGAPVVAVSSGTVVSATSDAVNGRMVRLRHTSGYESYYLHLSAFGAGIRRGAHVDQGQSVGRVGATGLATGPHLHYGLKKNDAWVDPLREHRRMPPGEPIAAAWMAAFTAVRDEAAAELRTAPVHRPVSAVLLVDRTAGETSGR